MQSICNAKCSLYIGSALEWRDLNAPNHRQPKYAGILGRHRLWEYILHNFYIFIWLFLLIPFNFKDEFQFIMVSFPFNFGFNLKWFGSIFNYFVPTLNLFSSYFT